jgi:hypothetical protein
MSRYKGKGWYFESQRHSLAAKGVRTKRFDFALIKKIDEGQPKVLTPQEIVEEKAREKKPFDMFKGPEEKSDYGKNRRRATIDEVQQMMNNRFRKLEREKKIRFEDSIRFLDHEYAPIARKFLDGHMDMDAFQYETDVAFQNFVKNNQKTLSPFAWGSGEQESFFNFEEQARRTG